MLAVLGTARTHQQNFPLFLGLVLGVSVLAVAVLILTATRDAPGPGVEPENR